MTDLENDSGRADAVTHDFDGLDSSTLLPGLAARLKEAEDLASRSVPTGPHRLPNQDRTIVAMHRRVLRMSRAVRVLLDADLPYEAAIVARALFEDSLKLGALEAAGADRTGMILSWISESMSQAERMLRLGERTGRFDPAEREKVIANRRAHLTRDAARMGVTGRWARFPDEATMAERQGRSAEYASYLYATQVAHGAETAYIFDPDPVGDGEPVAGTSRGPSVIIDAVLTLSATSVLRSHMSAATMLGWPGAVEAQAMFDSPLEGT